MRPHAEAGLSPRDYKEARLQLKLTQEQLAYETGNTLATIKNRESGDAPVRREAQLAMRWLAVNPPAVPADHVIRGYHRKTTSHTVGEKFGLFSILRMWSRAGKAASKRPNIMEVRCECGKERVVMAASFHHHFVCEPKCPARQALVDRGSTVNTRGEIIDKDGFPES